MKELLLARRTLLAAGAVACLVAGLFLLLLAADVERWRSALATGDVRYRVAPEAEGLWTADPLLPVGLGRLLAGVEDDLEFRLAVRALRLGRLEDPTISDPSLALRRSEAQARLEAIAVADGDPRRRSRAAALLGALGLARLTSETQNRAALLSSTIANLQYAIGLDSENAEAKFNLELALQRGRGVQLTEGAGGANPSPGGAGSKGAGAGDPGSGY